MIIWLIFAVLTAAVMLAVLRPFHLTNSAYRSRDAFDREVYRDQLSEVDRDLDRGVIGEEEAKAARIEISRRLIAAQEADEQSGEQALDSGRSVHSGEVFRKYAFWSTAMLIPALGLGGYLVLGRADLPALPHAARFEKPDTKQDFSVLVARVEERLRNFPNDGRGWKVLAPVYMRQGRYNEAADAFKRALTYLGESAELLSGYAEALISANRGIVSPEARRAYATVLKMNKGTIIARFRLAMAQEQDGNLKQAADEYRELLLMGDPESSWRSIVSTRLAFVNQQMLKGSSGAGPRTASNSAPSGTGTGPGPSAADVKAAQQMSTGDRSQMINNMVQRLASRLQSDGDDIEGWLRLVNAYMVLGKSDAAKTALGTARKQFSGKTAELARLDQLASRLDL